MPKCQRYFWRYDSPLFYHLYSFWQRESDSCIPNIVLTFLSPNCSFYHSLEIIVSHFDPTIKFESNCFWTNKNIQTSEILLLELKMTYILKPLNLNPILLSEFVQKIVSTLDAKVLHYYNVQTCKFESNSSFGICSKLFLHFWSSCWKS